MLISLPVHTLNRYLAVYINTIAYYQHVNKANSINLLLGLRPPGLLAGPSGIREEWRISDQCPTRGWRASASTASPQGGEAALIALYSIVWHWISCSSLSYDLSFVLGLTLIEFTFSEAHLAHIALSEPMTSIVLQGSRHSLCPTSPFSNSHYKPTFGSLTLCQVLYVGLHIGFLAGPSGIRRSMADSKPKGPRLRLGHLRVGKLHYCLYCIALEPLVQFNLSSIPGLTLSPCPVRLIWLTLHEMSQWPV